MPIRVKLGYYVEDHQGMFVGKTGKPTNIQEERNDKPLLIAAKKTIGHWK